MRLAFLAALLISASAAASAQTPANAPADRWHAKAREIYAHAISLQTVQGRNASPELAAYLQEQFRAGGLTGVTIHPYDADRGADPALAGGAARRAQGDPAHGPYGRGRGAPRGLVARSVHARGGGRLFLRARHARRQAGRHRDHHRPAPPARRGLPAQSRDHRPVHRRRGDRPATAPSSPPASGSIPRRSISRSTAMPAAAPSCPTARCSASASRPPRRPIRAIL